MADEITTQPKLSEDEHFSRLTLKNGRVCGDGYCRCSPSSRQAKCFQRNRPISYIPIFPPYVTQVSFKESLKIKLNQSSLVNLTGQINLVTLNFIGCKLEGISPGAFVGLENLKKLQLSNSSELSQNEVASALHGVSRSMEKLFLEQNAWTLLPDNMFHGLQGSNVSVLSLKGNRLQRFSGFKLLQGLHLKNVNLDGNSLYGSSVDIFNMNHVAHVDFRNNYQLMRIPGFCYIQPKSHKIISIMHNLMVLNLEGISLRKLLPTSFNCLPKLHTLHLDGNFFESIPSKIFAGLGQLTELYLDKLFYLKDIEEFAFQSDTLRSISFNSKFDFNVRGRNYSNIFRYCPNLEHLILSQNDITSGALFKAMVAPLKKLRRLIAVRVDLFDLKSGTFDHMQQLDRLVLTGNNLHNWPMNIFSNLPNLQQLYLDGNAITTITKHSFPAKLLASLKSIHLGMNPFSCNCELLWFRDWARETKKLEAYPFKYVCWSPSKLDGKLLSAFNETADDICQRPSPWVILRIVIPTVSVAFILVVILLYTQLPLIQNGVYLLRLKQSGYVKLVNEEAYKYSAYLVFCEQDRKWVIEYLYRILENEGIDACIPDRDFNVGDVHSDQIADNISKSKKLVVVLSNDFAQDEWCQWQLQFALERIRQKGKCCVVVILLKDINSKHMTSSIRQLLKSTPYATWNAGSLRQQLFRKIVIRAVQKPLGNPPVAVSTYGSVNS